MEDAHGAADASDRYVLEKKVVGTILDVVQEVNCVHSGAGDAATTITGAAATAGDLVEKEVAGSDSGVLELEVKAWISAMRACAQAGDEHVSEEVLLLISLS
ncbi:hypothetical protein D1007_09430 [Hordeum vulgare]|nr:hypothetical protein D1007_09430 [Hordeum vulgare]